MAYGRSKLLSSTEVPAMNMSTPTTAMRGVSADVPHIDSNDIDSADHARRELEHLRSINARLMRELGALQLREAEALRLADRDGLTGLYNRRRLLELLGGVIGDAAQLGQFVGILFIDLNGFKAVNDSYGHAAGDRILTTVAMRISAKVRTGDIVCRYGGDEFVVVLPSLPDAVCLNRISASVGARIALPYWIKGHEQHLSAAVGESIYPRDGVDCESLLHRADQNMYRLKPRTEHAAATSDTAQQLDRRRDDKSKKPIGGDP